jgi:hypothetical protein
VGYDPSSSLSFCFARPPTHPPICQSSLFPPPHRDLPACLPSFLPSFQLIVPHALQGLTVVVLGAGGAGRALAFGAAARGAASVVIANRSAQRAAELAAQLNASLGEGAGAVAGGHPWP